ncbi:hypothetical protein GQ457_10G015380 [Hibiscus cannabinus]
MSMHASIILMFNSTPLRLGLRYKKIPCIKLRQSLVLIILNGVIIFGVGGLGGGEDEDDGNDDSLSPI